MDNQPHTNNVYEGWKTKFVRLLAHGNQSICKLIKCLQIKHACVDSEIFQYQHRIHSVKRIIYIYIYIWDKTCIWQTSKVLHYICLDQAHRRICISDLMCNVYHNLHRGQPNIHSAYLPWMRHPCAHVCGQNICLP